MTLAWDSLLSLTSVRSCITINTHRIIQRGGIIHTTAFRHEDRVWTRAVKQTGRVFRGFFLLLCESLREIIFSVSSSSCCHRSGHAYRKHSLSASGETLRGKTLQLNVLLIDLIILISATL